MTDDNFFEKYLERDRKDKPTFFKSSKLWIFLVTLIIGIGIGVYFFKSIFMEGMSTEEIKKAVEIVYIDSKWSEKKGTPQEVKIIPSITIKVKNIGTRPLQYVDIEAVFEFEETGQVFDDGMVRLFQKPLQPGQTSDAITIKASFGYAASSRASFFNNKEKWKKMQAKLFVRSQGSGLARVGKIYPVKQEIEGYQESSPEPQTEKKEYSDEKTRELAFSLQIIHQDSLWIDKIVTAKEIIIVPSITIRVKNIGKKTLQNIYFRGVFRYENTGEILSEGITPGLSGGLNPGATSDPIEIKGDFGYSAKSNEDFIQSHSKWRQLKVNVFAKGKDTEYALLGTYPIKSRLQVYE
ncbi:MAG: hypothetical protein ACM3SY_20685 [Candidatus Omnitrophota bacterium]